MKKLILFTLLILPLAFASCGSDDEPNYSNQTLAVGSVYAIPGGSTGWTSDNELIASVSTNGVTAEHVGETYIRNGNKSFKVTVTPKYNTFKEPYLNFGASKTTVKNFMSSFNLNKEQNDALLYDGSFPVMYYLYSFKNAVLNMSSAVIKVSSVSADDMVAFLQERYVFVTMDEDKYYFGFVSPDEKTLVVLQIDTLNSQVVYMIAYAEVSAYSTSAQTMKMMKKHLAPSSTTHGAEVKAEYSRLLDVMPEMKSEYNIINK